MEWMRNVMKGRKKLAVGERRLVEEHLNVFDNCDTSSLIQPIFDQYFTRSNTNHWVSSSWLSKRTRENPRLISSIHIRSVQPLPQTISCVAKWLPHDFLNSGSVSLLNCNSSHRCSSPATRVLGSRNFHWISIHSHADNKTSHLFSWIFHEALAQFFTLACWASFHLNLDLGKRCWLDASTCA